MTVPSRRASVHEFRTGVSAEIRAESRKRPSSSRASPSSSPFSYKTADIPHGILRNSSRYPVSALRPNGAGERKRGSIITTASPRLYPNNRDRFLSLPVAGSLRVSHTLSDAFNPRHFDVEHDRLAKACGQDALSASASSPVLWDVSEEYFAQPSSKTRHHSLTFSQAHGIRSPRPGSRTSSHPRRGSPPPAPRFPRPNREAVLESLENDLANEGRHVEEFFGRDGRENCCFSCRQTFEECPQGRWGCLSNDSEHAQLPMYSDSSDRVFHVPLELLHDNAMTTATVVGYLHDLPLVVVTCVEELYRTGIYQRDLFRALPDRPRLSRLVQRFNHVPSQPVSSRLPSFAHETTSNICSLLGDYIASLPGPLLPPSVFDAIWSWSVNPSLAEETAIKRNLLAPGSQGHAHDDSNYDGVGPQREIGQSPISRVTISQRSSRRAASDSFNLRHSYQNSTPKARVRANQVERELHDLETPHISIACHLLLLLPPRSFSLIVYLLSFFSQIPLSPENGLTFEDVARIFATQLFGGPNRGAARIIMVWLLDRWSRILEGFENFEDQNPQPSEEDLPPVPGAVPGQKVRFFDEVTDAERTSSLNNQRVRSTASGRIRSYTVDETKISSRLGEPVGFRKQLEKLVYERDDAVRVVQEIRRVVGERPI